MVDQWSTSFLSSSSSSHLIPSSPLIPEGVVDPEEVSKCEEWLERQDAVPYSRDFQKDSVLVSGMQKVSLDVVGLVDEWAARFFEELDYVNEGENGTRFAELMREDLPQVVIPDTFHKYTSRRVLTTQWIEGGKLSQSTESDVGELVNVGVICYLKQLLDTGFFHADPHPGNMIRTPDGKLAILDFGVFSVEVDVEKQKVTVQTNVDSSTLIKKLKIAGKRAEAWPDNKPSNQAKSNSNSKQQKPGGGNKKSKEQQGKQQQQNKFQHKPLPSYSSDDEEDSNDEEEDDMRMLDKILKQGSNNHNAKKGGNGDTNNNATMAALQRMMNGNANGNGNGSVAGSGFGLQSQVPMPVNYHGQAHHLPAMARNHNMQQQPQMMYLRSPQVAPYTGYYPSPYYYQSDQPYNDYVTHLFSDENTRGCVIM